MNAPSRTVAIIGAGPAGLVAAKTLLGHASSPFHVTVFEQHDRVGGMWALSPDDSENKTLPTAESDSDSTSSNFWQPKCTPGLRTNLSRFTVSFSDLSWDNVDPAAGPSPIFPSAWQVGKYMEVYARTYLPSAVLRLRTHVHNVERVDSDGPPRWTVKWSSAGNSGMNNGNEDTFDHLIVASGFFAAPKPLDLQLPSPMPDIKRIHSSRLGRITDILPSPMPSRGTFVVVGGGMSGVEAATAIALQISDSKWSPEQGRSAVSEYTVTHITNRPAYILPRYLPYPFGSRPAFVPMDFALYELGRRPSGPITFGLGLTTPERAQQLHSYLNEITGGDALASGSEELRHTETDKKDAAYVAISDGYNGFNREGLIKPVRGTAVGVQAVGDTVSVKVDRVSAKNEIESISIPNVIAIVYATGFSPHTSVSFLPQAVREQLHADWSCERIPFILHDTISHPSNPSLAFVGFYDGPFWGVMEMQARMIAERWASDVMAKPQDAASAAAGGGRKRADGQGMDAISELQALWGLRAAMKRGEKSVPQYTLGDYVGLVEKFSGALGIQREQLAAFEDGRKGPLIPARYHLDVVKEVERVQIEAVLKDASKLIVDATSSTRFLAAAAFTALAGPWKLERTLASRLPEFPSGEFTGTAVFHPRLPTDKKFDHEYLYVEDGTLKTTAGFEMKASRRYAYRYSAEKDQLSAWFVKDDGKSVDYLFHNVEFIQPDTIVVDGQSTSSALQEASHVAGSAFHHCSPDDYSARYGFKFFGAALSRFSIAYDVTGPKKDYITDARYSR